MLSIELSHQEIIELLGSKAKTEGDSFMLKVFRRQSPGAMPVSIATFDDAQVSHFQSPEKWLPRIAGGGPFFLLHAYHIKEPHKLLGAPITLSIPADALNPPREVDPSVTAQPDWQGPNAISFPPFAHNKAPPQGASAGYRMSPAPTDGTSAAAYGPAGGGPGTSPEHQRLWDLERERLREKERALDDEKRRLEMDNLRREHEAKLREFEMRLLQTSKPQASIVETVAAITAAFTPLVTTFLAGQAETRRELERARSEQAARSEQLMQQLLTRPLIDPGILTILEKSRAEQIPQTQMLHSMSEAMASMTQTTMDMVRTAAELQGNGQPDEPVTIKIIREGMKSINSMFAATRMQSAQQQQPQQRQAPQQERRRLPPQAPQQPAPVKQEAAPQPQNGAEKESVSVGPVPAFNGAEEEETAIEYLVALIKEHHNPVEVVTEIFEVMEEEDFQAELAEVGSFNALVMKHLGDWMSEDDRNANYLQLLMKELNKQGVERGLITEETPEGIPDEAFQGDEDEPQAEA